MLTLPSVASVVIGAMILARPPAVAGPLGDRADSVAVRSTVESFFRAVERGTRDSALALMTPEWRARELEWRGGFISAFFNRGIKVKSWEIRELSVAGDSAFVRVGTTLLVDGEEDGEPMRFSLIRSEGRWLIRRLD